MGEVRIGDRIVNNVAKIRDVLKDTKNTLVGVANVFATCELAHAMFTRVFVCTCTHVSRRPYMHYLIVTIDL